MYFITQLAVTEQVAAGPSISLVIVGIVGFIAAAGIGSIAWYNSKRPLGLEDKKRPDFVPKVEVDK